VKNFNIIINKLRNYIFLLLIFLIPAQLGRHFWPEWSLVNGLRIDYLSPTIYATDVLILFLFLFSLPFFFLSFPSLLWRDRLQRESRLIIQSLKFKVQNYSAKFKVSVAVVFVLLFAIFINNINPLSVIKLFKILEIFIFAYLVKIYVNKENYRQFIFVLSLSMLFQSFLAIAQFFNHGSLNGIFWFFGERNFSSGTPGIANASINGNLILRPYGTLPHPNALAGFLLIGIILLLNFLSMQAQSSKFKVQNYRSKFKISKQFSNLTIQQWFYIGVIVISSLALFLTLSRVAILLLVGFMLFHFIRRGRPPGRPAFIGGQTRRFVPTKLTIVIVVISIAIVSYLLFPRFSSIFTEDSESFVKRVDQTKIAVQMIKDHPLIGVGLSRYLVELPNYLKGASFRDYQPAHNVFLLILVEMGIVGFFLLCTLGLTQIMSRLTQIKNMLKNSNGAMEQWSNVFIVFVVVVISLFDHYFYTIQQGNLMIGLLLGLANLKFKSQNEK
jgi:O-antigen ligase